MKIYVILKLLIGEEDRHKNSIIYLKIGEVFVYHKLKTDCKKKINYIMYFDFTQKSSILPLK